jgi:hypothetical protein
MKMKECRRCHILKPITEYHKNKHMKEGIVHRCKSCQKLLHDAWYLRMGFKKPCTTK